MKSNSYSNYLKKFRNKNESVPNPAKYYGNTIETLERYAEQNNIPLVKVLDRFIVELQNYYDKEYRSKLVDDTLKDVSPEIISNIISYINRIKKTYVLQRQINEKRAERNSKKQEIQSKWEMIEKEIDIALSDDKKGNKISLLQSFILNIENGEFKYNLNDKEKRYILKKLNEKLSKVINENEQDKKNIENAKKALKGIEEIIDRECSKDDAQRKIDFWLAINVAIQEDNVANINLDKLSKGAKKQLQGFIEEKITAEKDRVYFNQVKSFTRNFSFLKEYPEVQGVRSRKFTDKVAYERFFNLRERLGHIADENLSIKMLLHAPDISDVDKEILNERFEVLKKEKYKNTVGTIGLEAR